MLSSENIHYIGFCILLFIMRFKGRNHQSVKWQLILMINPWGAKLNKLCLATAIHNFKCVKITHICLMWDQAFPNLDV